MGRRVGAWCVCVDRRDGREGRVVVEAVGGVASKFATVGRAIAWL